MYAMLLIVILLLCPLGAIARNLDGHAKNPELTQNSSYSKSETTEKKLFNVKMILRDKRLKVGNNNLDILLSDEKGNNVLDAIIRIFPFISDHGESTLIKPTVTEKGNGLYSVENVYITIEGHWVLKVYIRKDNSEDSALFDFPHVKR